MCPYEHLTIRLCETRLPNLPSPPPSFEIEGYTAGFGVPAWKQSHLPAARTAPCVADLVAAGAKLTGTTAMDEMAYRWGGGRGEERGRDR